LFLKKTFENSQNSSNTVRTTALLEFGAILFDEKEFRGDLLFVQSPNFSLSLRRASPAETAK